MSEPALTHDSTSTPAQAPTLAPTPHTPPRRPPPTWREIHRGDDPSGESLQIEHWRQASAALKLRELASLNALARRLAMTGLRLRYPAAGPAELQRRLADLLLGAELALAVYGPLVEDTQLT